VRALTLMVLLGLAPLLVGVGARAQIRSFGGQLGGGARIVQHPYDGAFRFCRVQFRNSYDGDGSGWFVDYPRADLNLSTRLSEVTKTRVSRTRAGAPGVTVVSLTSAELFACPFVMVTEPGGAYFDEGEARALNAYLQKGGFLWADDSWGSDAWNNWTRQLAKALPPSEFPIVPLPMSHPMFHTLFDIARVPQIPNVGLWLNARQTSERGADSAEVYSRAILDRTGRVMVYMTHNTDFGDAYEEEAVSPDYFRTFSVQAYAIGVDLLLYAMTH
jgi:hypothetical protein